MTIWELMLPAVLVGAVVLLVLQPRAFRVLLALVGLGGREAWDR